MNEGSGDYAIDKAQGANATLRGAAWARPRGLSLHTDGTGIDLKQEAITRTSEQDYTLMFWFKTTGKDGTLVSNGPGRKTDAGAQNALPMNETGTRSKHSIDRMATPAATHSRKTEGRVAPSPSLPWQRT